MQLTQQLHCFTYLQSSHWTTCYNQKNSECSSEMALWLGFKVENSARCHLYCKWESEIMALKYVQANIKQVRNWKGPKSIQSCNKISFQWQKIK